MNVPDRSIYTGSEGVEETKDNEVRTPGSIEQPYKLTIVGGGPSGCSIIVRAIRTGFEKDLCGFSTHEPDKELNEEGQLVHPAQFPSSLAGVCMIDGGPLSGFGGGKLQDYVINANTWATKFVSNVTAEKPDVLPAESVVNTTLHKLNDRETAIALKGFGCKPAPLQMVGAFLRDVGTVVSDTFMLKYPDSSKVLMESNVTEIQRVMLPVKPGNDDLSKVFGTVPGWKVTIRTRSSVPSPPTLNSPVAPLGSKTNEEATGNNDNNNNNNDDDDDDDDDDDNINTARNNNGDHDVGIGSQNRYAVQAHWPPVVYTTREIFTHKIALATGGVQRLPCLPNASHNRKLMSSDVLCTEKGVQELRERLLRAHRNSSSSGSSSSSSSSLDPTSARNNNNNNNNNNSGGGGVLSRAPGRVVIVGGSHSAFSAAWICLHRLKQSHGQAEGVPGRSTTTTGNTTSNSDKYDSEEECFNFCQSGICIVHKSNIKVFYCTKGDADRDGYVIDVPHSSSNEDGAVGGSGHGTPSQYQNRNSSGGVSMGPPSTPSALSKSWLRGQIHPFGGLRGDAKELWRATKNGSEVRLRLLQVRQNVVTLPPPNRAVNGDTRLPSATTTQKQQSIVEKLFDEAVVIVWACGYATNVQDIAIKDVDGVPIPLKYRGGQVEVDDNARVLLGGDHASVASSTPGTGINHKRKKKGGDVGGGRLADKSDSSKAAGHASIAVNNDNSNNEISKTGNTKPPSCDQASPCRCDRDDVDCTRDDTREDGAVNEKLAISISRPCSPGKQIVEHSTTVSTSPLPLSSMAANTLSAQPAEVYATTKGLTEIIGNGAIASPRVDSDADTLCLPKAATSPGLFPSSSIAASPQPSVVTVTTSQCPPLLPVVEGLMGSGLGYGLQAVNENGLPDGSSGRADGVAVYLKRGATLILAQVLGLQLFGGPGIYSWEDRAKLLKKMAVAAAAAKAAEAADRLASPTASSSATTATSVRTGGGGGGGGGGNNSQEPSSSRSSSMRRPSTTAGIGMRGAGRGGSGGGRLAQSYGSFGSSPSRSGGGRLDLGASLDSTKFSSARSKSSSGTTAGGGGADGVLQRAISSRGSGRNNASRSLKGKGSDDRVGEASPSLSTNRHEGAAADTGGGRITLANKPTTFPAVLFPVESTEQKGSGNISSICYERPQTTANARSSDNTRVVCDGASLHAGIESTAMTSHSPAASMCVALVEKVAQLSDDLETIQLQAAKEFLAIPPDVERTPTGHRMLVDSKQVDIQNIYSPASSSIKGYTTSPAVASVMTTSSQQPVKMASPHKPLMSVSSSNLHTNHQSSKNSTSSNNNRQIRSDRISKTTAVATLSTSPRAESSSLLSSTAQLVGDHINRCRINPLTRQQSRSYKNATGTVSSPSAAAAKEEGIGNCKLSPLVDVGNCKTKIVHDTTSRPPPLEVLPALHDDDNINNNNNNNSIRFAGSGACAGPGINGTASRIISDNMSINSSRSSSRPPSTSSIVGMETAPVSASAPSSSSFSAVREADDPGDIPASAAAPLFSIRPTAGMAMASSLKRANTSSTTNAGTSIVSSRNSASRVSERNPANNNDNKKISVNNNNGGTNTTNHNQVANSRRRHSFVGPEPASPTQRQGTVVAKANGSNYARVTAAPSRNNSSNQASSASSSFSTHSGTGTRSELAAARAIANVINASGPTSTSIRDELLQRSIAPLSSSLSPPISPDAQVKEGTAATTKQLPVSINLMQNKTIKLELPSLMCTGRVGPAMTQRLRVQRDFYNSSVSDASSSNGKSSRSVRGGRAGTAETGPRNRLDSGSGVAAGARAVSNYTKSRHENRKSPDPSPVGHMLESIHKQQRLSKFNSTNNTVKTLQQKKLII